MSNKEAGNMCKTCAAHNPPKTAGKPAKKGTTKKK
jgi:hypothetical protein